MRNKPTKSIGVCLEHKIRFGAFERWVHGVACMRDLRKSGMGCATCGVGVKAMSAPRSVVGSCGQPGKLRKNAATNAVRTEPGAGPSSVIFAAGVDCQNA